MTSALNEKIRKKSVRLETRAIKPIKELAVSEKSVTTSFRFDSSTIKPNKDFAISSESATSSLEKEYNDALSALNKALDDIKKSNEPALTVEGITIDSPSSPVSIDAESTAQTVSIVQDAADDELKQKIINSITGPQPIVLSSIKIPILSYNEAKSAIEINQFERQILKEILTKGLRSIGKNDPKETFKATKATSKQGSDILNEQIEAVSYLNRVCTVAASGLNISSLSSQIMQRASDALSSIITPSESSNYSLPKNLDKYIALTFTNDSVLENFTNTSRLTVLMQDMLLSALTIHPSLMRFFSRDVSGTETLFFTPGRFGYDPDGPGGNPEVSIPTCSDLLSQNEIAIITQFIRSKRVGPADRPNLGILNNGNAENLEEAWDTIGHLISCLSNEMIISAGIGRLVGSQLGNRFLERSADNQKQFRPFDRVLGFSPTATPSEISKFFNSGPDKKGSYLDYLALGEEVENREFVVMPFETSTVINDKGLPFVSGKKYFIDLAVQADQNSAVDQRGAIKRFSKDFKQFNSDMSSYVSEILALDTETKLAPQFLLARIFQDIASVAKSLDRDDDQIDSKSSFASAFIAVTGFEPNRLVSVVSTNSDTIEVTASDILKASVIKALRDFDNLTGDTTYTLSNLKTEYSTDVSPSDNFESNLKKSIRPLINSFRFFTEEQKRTFREEVSHVRYQFKENEFLHDLNFASDSNLINLIARSIREIQKESSNLSHRNGAKSDYRNSDKRTYLSDCDDDRLIDVVCNLYSKVAYLTLPVSITNGTFSSEETVGITHFGRGSARVCSILLEDIVRSLISGSPINVETIQQNLSIDPETTISAVGNNTITSTVADVVAFSSKMPQHRYYIKSSLKILEAASAGVVAASSSLVNVFDILNGAVKRDNLKGYDATLYDMFVTNKRVYENTLRNFDEYQVNLIAASKYIFESSEDIYLRRDIDVSSAEREALRVFLREMFDKRSPDDLHLVSVGIPSGLLESLYTPTIALQGSDSDPSISRRSLNVVPGSTVRIELDRYDEVHVNNISGVELDIFGDSSDYEFDPEIFILPDSIAYDPKKVPTGSINEFDAVFRSTTFFRIRGGKIVEQISGMNLPVGKEHLFMNCLRSYLLDLYSYETVKIRYLDGIGQTGPASVTKSAFDLLKLASNDMQMSKLLCSKVGFIDILNSASYEIKTSYDLKDLLTSSSPSGVAKFSLTDIKITSLVASMFPLSDRSGAVVNRPFERIYNFLYDESFARLHLTGEDADRTRSRRNFDIYTLAARVVNGGK